MWYDRLDGFKKKKYQVVLKDIAEKTKLSEDIISYVIEELSLYILKNIKESNLVETPIGLFFKFRHKERNYKYRGEILRAPERDHAKFRSGQIVKRYLKNEVSPDDDSVRRELKNFRRIS